MVAGEDHTIPPATVQANFKKYKHTDARTDYLEFEGRAHLHMVQDGWQEITDAISAWLDEVLSASADPAVV
jgi:hypothetical protein